VDGRLIAHWGYPPPPYTRSIRIKTRAWASPFVKEMLSKNAALPGLTYFYCNPVSQV
jgi:hypothetical protein